MGVSTLLILAGCGGSEGVSRFSDNFFKMVGISFREHFDRFLQIMGAMANVGWAILIILIILVALTVWYLRRARTPNVNRLVEKRDLVGLLEALAYKRECLSYTNRPEYEQYENNIAAQIRAEAAFALGRFKNPRTVDALIEALGDWNRDVRINAVRALIEIGDKRAIDPLLEVARNDPDDYARQSVQEALRAKGF